MKAKIYIGIDVGKAKLDVAVRVSESDGAVSPAKRADKRALAWTVNNTDAGVAEILERLRKLGPERIVLEATGGYEQRVFLALREAGLPAVIVQGLHVREFARAMGRRAKTDAIDAAMIAHFAEIRQPEVLPMPTANQKRLAALRALRTDFIASRTQYTNRLENCTPEVREYLEEHLRVLDNQVTRLDAELAAALAAEPEDAAKAALVRSVPGIGPTISAALVGELPELGKIDRRRLSALVGVAPMNRDSGQKHGKRFTQGGRRALRNLLYMAAHNARLWNPVIRAFAQRLEAKGKPYHVVMTACMRKLLVILNAMVLAGTPWSLPA